MRGLDGRTGAMFSYVDLEERVPAGHPLRKVGHDRAIHLRSRSVDGRLKGGHDNEDGSS
jgi:hypothetical protein